MSCSRRMVWRSAVAMLALAGCGSWEQEQRADVASAASVPKGTVVRVTPAVPLPTEGFGRAVAVTRGALAVTDFAGTDRVHVHAYALVDGAAVGTGVLRPDSAADGCFGQALDLDGDLLAVGVPCADGGAGAVMVYRWEGALGAWAPLATLRPPAPGLAGFGTSVALGSNLLAVGAPHTGGETGAVHLYGRDLALAATLVAAEAAPWDLFGQAIALSGDLLAVAAPGRRSTDALVANGRVHVFTRSDGVWAESAALAAATCLPGEDSGWAVAAGDGVVAVGGDRYVSHSIHVFERGAGGWTEDDLEEEERGAPDCGYAHSLALEGGVLAVGMPTLTGPGGEYRAGAVHVHRRMPEGWVRTAEILTGVAGDKVGHAVDLSGGVLAVGAPGTYLYGPDGTLANLGAGAALVLRP